MTKEDQERIEKEMLEYGTSANYSLWTVGFKEGAEYEHPIAYNKGLEDGKKEQIDTFRIMYISNSDMHKEGFNEALEEVMTNLMQIWYKKTASEIYDEIEKLKR